MAEKQKSIMRKLYFYKVICNTKSGDAGLSTILEEYARLHNQDNSNLIERNLAIPIREDKLCFLELEHTYGNRIFKGKLHNLRRENFPRVLNTSNGESRKITSKQDDVLLEQTHFIYIPDANIIVGEYNHYGIIIEYLSTYLNKVMEYYDICSHDIHISHIFIPDYFEELARCSSIKKLQFKAPIAGLKLLKDHGIINTYDLLEGSINDASEVTFNLEITADRIGAIALHDSKKVLGNIINCFRSNKNESKCIKKATVVAYNEIVGKNVMYDLLNEKLMQECLVDKITGEKYVDSKDMYAKLITAYNQKKNTALQYIEQ